MTSLAQVLATHSTALVIDAASSCVQVGWIRARGDEAWHSSDQEAGIGIFQAIESLGRNPADAEAFVFCDGPGSILGIRTVATALRAWRVVRPTPVFAYCSLALVAQSQSRAGLSVIADARRNTWHVYRVGESLRRVDAQALSGELVMPEGFRHWSPVPTNTRVVPYVVRDLLHQVREAELLSPTETPDAFLHEEPSYVTWTPQIHRAPSP